MCFRAGDFIGRLFAGALKTQLNMIETRLNELVKPRLVKGHPGSNEIDIEPGLAGGTDKVQNIGAGQRLSACKIDLENTRFDRFAKHTRPNLGSQFVGATPQLKGI